jgi:hypothetical protein
LIFIAKRLRRRFLPPAAQSFWQHDFNSFCATYSVSGSNWKKIVAAALPANLKLIIRFLAASAISTISWNTNCPLLKQERYCSVLKKEYFYG